jgi:anion-transporting  ArsA/GET3 family ATPase
MTRDAAWDALVGDARIVVCVGTGGVGKTTLAASIALEAARRGQRALVLTIDPARRLADALGIGELGNQPRELPPELHRRLGLPDGAHLFAVMLDMKRTFDDLVERLAASEEARQRILANPIYQQLSDALAGSGEYAAMEKVYELLESQRYDLVVLDTPPSQHALDFLDAPRKLLEFIDSRVVKLLVHPALSAGRFGFRLFQGATQRALKLIERLSGIGFLEDISEFLLAFEDMSAGFRDRATRVQSMLLGPEARFVLVAAPSPEAARNAELFLTRLEAMRVPLSGIAINRTRLWPGGGAPAQGLRCDDATISEALETDLVRLAEALDPDAQPPVEGRRAALAALAVARQYAGLVQLDRDSTSGLRAHARRLGVAVRDVPELACEVHDLDGLSLVAVHLFGSDAPDERSAPHRQEV